MGTSAWVECGVRGAAGVTFEIASVGGGVNGQRRRWSVYLCEKGDLTSSTSSASSKLIREALIEREILWRIAPPISCGRFA